MIELVLVAALSGYAGYQFGKPGEPPKCEPNPLIKTVCGELVPPADASFGATTLTLINTNAQYYKCRAACVGGE